MFNKKSLFMVLSGWMLFTAGFSACSDGSGGGNNPDKTKSPFISAIVFDKDLCMEDECTSYFSLSVTFIESLANVSTNGFSIYINDIRCLPFTFNYNDGALYLELLLDADIDFMDKVTVEYDSDAGTITNSAGVPVYSFGPSVVTNYVTQETKSPQFYRAVLKEQTPTKVEVTFDEAVRLSDAAGFTINANGSSYNKVSGITKVSGSGSHTIVFSFDAAIQEGDSISVEYDDTAGGNARDIHGTRLVSFSEKTVLNSVGAPKFVSAEVDRGYSPLFSIICIACSEDIVEASLAWDWFTIKINNNEIDHIFNIWLSKNNIIIELNMYLFATDTITVQYNGADATITDTAGNPLASFGPVDVTNNVPQN